MVSNVVMIIAFTLMFIFSVHSNAFTFNLSAGVNSTLTTKYLTFEGEPYSISEYLQLNKNQNSIDRASYRYQIPLWNSTTKELGDFSTHFTFMIESTNRNDTSAGGDGLAFFIAPFNSKIPTGSKQKYLGLFSPDKALNKSLNNIVAVEFDTYSNEFDPESDHVGIDINSIESVNSFTWGSPLTNGKMANAWITYNATTHNLSVFLTYDINPVFDGMSSTLWHVEDLSKILPSMVTMGFSGTTAKNVELHNIYAWSFNSSLGPSGSSIPAPGIPDVPGSKLPTLLVVGIVVSVVCLVCGVIGVYSFMRRKKIVGRNEDVSLDDEFEIVTGPQKFSYAELARATNTFDEKGKLGQGGFGGVYKGLLSVSNTEIAVKKISAGSQQGKKEYISEVKIISRLKHKNLVQLIGWCHKKEELLLVYEYMPNGSLDSHLFGKNVPLTWVLRYRIALGLASALLYLHEDNEYCVVHRDIKASNVMLDSKFNAKLGDFGLARFVDHKLGPQTTVLAGTMGYLAPECLTTGKSSKESDVYSFGVVALEIACGRKSIEILEVKYKVSLVEWVWELYKNGQLVDAVDTRLKMAFDEAEMEGLMVAGLWCCHPDPTLRPSIRQVVNILNFDVPLSTLPSKQLAPVFPVVHSTNEDPYDYINTTDTTDSGKDHMTQSFAPTTDSTGSPSSTFSLLRA